MSTDERSVDIPELTDSPENLNEKLEKTARETNAVGEPGSLDQEWNRKKGLKGRAEYLTEEINGYSHNYDTKELMEMIGKQNYPLVVETDRVYYIGEDGEVMSAEGTASLKEMQ